MKTLKLSEQERQVILKLREKENKRLRSIKDYALKVGVKAKNNYEETFEYKRSYLVKTSFEYSAVAKHLNKLFSDKKIKKYLEKDSIKFETKKTKRGGNYCATSYISAKDFEEFSEEVDLSKLTIEDFGLNSSEYTYIIVDNMYNEAEIKRTFQVSIEVEESTFELGYYKFRTWGDTPKLELEWANVGIEKDRRGGISRSNKVSCYCITKNNRNYSTLGLAKKLSENNEIQRLLQKHYEFNKGVKSELMKQMEVLFNQTNVEIKYIGDLARAWNTPTAEARFKDGSVLSFDLVFKRESTFTMAEPYLILNKVHDGQELEGEEKIDYWVNKIIKQNKTKY